MSDFTIERDSVENQYYCCFHNGEKHKRILFSCDNPDNLDAVAQRVYDLDQNPDLGLPSLSKAEMAAALALEAVRKQRRKEYPRLEEQLDMLFHELYERGNISTAGEWYRAIAAVKTAHPKP